MENKKDCIVVKGEGIAPMLFESKGCAWAWAEALIERGLTPTVENLGPKQEAKS